MLGSTTGPFVMGMSHQQLRGDAPALTLRSGSLLRGFLLTACLGVIPMERCRETRALIGAIPPLRHHGLRGASA